MSTQDMSGQSHSAQGNPTPGSQNVETPNPEVRPESVEGEERNDQEIEESPSQQGQGAMGGATERQFTTQIDEQEGAAGEAFNQQSTADPREQEELGRGARRKIFTERGFAYQVELKRRNLKIAINHWRRQVEYIDILTTDSQDVQALKTERDALRRARDDIEEQMSSLLQISPDESLENLDRVREQTTDIIRMIGDRIRSITDDSRSTTSRRSSKASTRSRTSIKAKAAAKAAELKTKLEYMKRDPAMMFEIDRFNTEKDLAVAKAKLKAAKEEQVTEEDTDELSKIPSDPDRVQRYVNQLASADPEYPSNVENMDLTERIDGGHVAKQSRDEIVNERPANSDSHPKEVSAPPSAVTMVSVPTTVLPSLGGMQYTSATSHRDVYPIVTHATTAASSTNALLYQQQLPTVNPEMMPPVCGPIATPSAYHTADAMPAERRFGADANTRFSTKATEAPVNVGGLAQILSQQMFISRLPPPEPGVFDGNAFEYNSWKRSFELLIEQKPISPAEKLHYLRRYVSGPARECIEGFLLESSDNAFDDAKRRLDKRFGDPYNIASAFRDKLYKWPRVFPRDPTALQRLSDFLKQCESAMKTNSNLSILNDCRENQTLLKKLPEWLTNRWARTVQQYKELYGTYPPFAVFSEFIAKEAELASDPVTSLQAIRDNDATTQKRPSNRSQTLVTQTKEDKPAKTPTKTEADIKQYPCVLCGEAHVIDVCEGFLQKSLAERQDFVKKERLCFSCLQKGHVSKKCRKKKKCNVCYKPHPTALHDYNRQIRLRQQEDQPNEESEPETTYVSSHATHLVKGNTIQKSTLILPVYVSHEKRPGKEHLTYALLDTQSDTSFVTRGVCQALDVDGPDTNLCISTMSDTDQMIKCKKISGLRLRGFRESKPIALNRAYTRNSIPVNRNHIPTQEAAMKWPHLREIAEQLMPVADCEVGILVGYNCARALAIRDYINPPGEGPFAQKTALGWGVIGILDRDTEHDDDHEDRIVTHRVLTREIEPSLATNQGRIAPKAVTFSIQTTKIKEVINPIDIAKILEADFIEKEETKEKSFSREEQKFMKIMEENVKVTKENHYEMPLPFKEQRPTLPDNKALAMKRLKHLKKRLASDSQYRKDYTSFMQDLIERGYAERVPLNYHPPEGQTFYIPHHGVYHPKKPGKIRVVFSCNSKYMGVSLNDVLLQGPDMLNALIGVLLRFRKEPIAISCDIEKMFFQFKVQENHRDFLRFLWWPKGDISAEPAVFRMTVHVFGAVSSPAVANFGLKRAADDGEADFGKEVADFIRSEFYVDDGLTSTETPREAIQLVSKTKQLCAKFGIRLHKFASNSIEVLQSIPEDDRAKGLQKLDIGTNSSIERALGIEWEIQHDQFQFRITIKDRPLTRRGILSAVSTLYDPLGFLCPVVLTGKAILQDICRQKADWDDPLPESIIRRWINWRNDLHHLEKVKIERCYKPKDFGPAKTVELHHFSDASANGYGQCSYLRFVGENGKIHCTLVLGKARVTPLRQISIPRLELTAALLSVKMNRVLKRELKYPDIEEHYWTDSKVILGYISNDTRRFHVFVANRVQQIRDQSVIEQWNYVTTRDNPADIASRGVSASALVDNSSWFNGPEFLWSKSWQEYVQKDSTVEECKADDPEVKKHVSLASNAQDLPTSFEVKRLDYFSTWRKAVRAVAHCKKFIRILRKRIHGEDETNTPLTVDEICDAESVIIKAVQKNAFDEEIQILEEMNANQENHSERDYQRGSKSRLKKRSTLYRLNPFLDSDGIIRVGGRLKESTEDFKVKYPIVLPKNGHITQLIIRHFHEKVQHQGRGITINEIRASGFWVVGMRSAVARYIHKCVKCRRWRGFVVEQKMADLPSDRVCEAPPFTYSAVDLFGPFTIKERRKELKRYGVLFTCMACRAIHLETSIALTTDSFINALRRFISIRGPVRQLRCDQGTNFIGANNELQKEATSMNPQKLKDFLLSENCDMIEFKTNVPAASHMGGVWERQIRTVRSVLNTLLQNCSTQLDDESLRTLFCEAAAIVNSRPLTVDNLCDSSSPKPLTPNHLLTMKSKVILPPPGQFQRTDIYSKKRWKRVQYLANEFWTRWKKEYLSNLQERQKWNNPKRNLSNGDIVLLKDDMLPRNQWQLAVVEDTYPSSDGQVRKVRLRMGDTTLNKQGKRGKPVSFLDRPVQKVVLLLESVRDRSIPAEEP